MNTSNPFGSQQSGVGNPFGGQQSGASNPFGGQQPGAGNPFGGQQSGASNPFGSQQSGTSSSFSGQQSGASNLFGSPLSSVSSTFGGQQSGTSSTLGGHQSGASSTFGGQQLGIFPTTSSSSAGAFQVQQQFQFGQPSSFGQSTGASSQPSFGQDLGGAGKNPSFGKGASVSGQTSLFTQSAGVTGQTVSFRQGNETSGQTSLFGKSGESSGQTSLFGQSSRTSGQTSVFGHVTGESGHTSNFGQGSGVAGLTSGFSQGSGAGGLTSGFGQQGSESLAKGTSFGQSLPVPGHPTLFGSGTGAPVQTTSFGPSIGTLAQPMAFGKDSRPAVQTTSGFGPESAGSGKSLAFPQSSGVSQSSSSRPTLGFGHSSAFGQPPGFTQPPGIRHVAPLGTTTTAPSNSTSASDQGFSFRPTISVSSTFPSPPSLGKTSGVSSGVTDFKFKAPENATFKPIFGDVTEPESSQAKITQESFTFSQPASSMPAAVGPASFSPLSASTSTTPRTGATLSFSKSAHRESLAPAFAFALPNRKGEEESLAPKAPFGSAGSSFTSFSSSSAGLLSMGQAFQRGQSVKQENEEVGDTSEQPGGLAKGLKRKEEQDYSPRRYSMAEDPEQSSKSDRPPEKRPPVLNRPSNKLFGRVLKDVLKSNEQIGRLREVKREECLTESRQLEKSGSSQATRGLPRTPAVDQGLMQARTKSRKRKGSANKTPRLRRRNSSADSVGDVSPSKSTAVQIKNIPDHLNKIPVVRKKFRQYGKVERVFCRPETKVATVHFHNHAVAEEARRLGQSWHPDISIFFVKKKPSPGKKRLSSAGKGDKTVQDSPGRQSADVQNYQQSPVRKPLVRSSGGAGSLLSKGSPVQKSDSATSLLFEADSFDSGSEGHSSDSLVSSLSASLSHLSGTLGENAEERYRVLDQRDKILRQARVRRTDLDSAHAFVGTCPDMCPEKERYMRETRNQLSIYEVIPGTDKVDHAAAVKEYSRSSADQEEPLPHELRPTPVLCMTMDYLIKHVMDQGEGNYREWYDFVWNRTRAIRKDITQQHLCDSATVSLIEKCMRFHIHCAHHLCEEPRSAFEAKINLENTTKCLQSLKEMYQDLANKGTRCSGEAEFRGYSVLLNLNKGDILREVQQFQPDVRNSPEVKFAVQAFAAFNSTNFVRFFRLVKSATYLSSCILHSYFSQIRRDALKSLNVAYTSTQRPTIFPVEMVVRMLLFRDDDEATEFLTSYGLSVSDGFVELNRLSFSEPESSLKLKKSLFIEQKRLVSIGEVVNGGALPPLILHAPVCSFNSQNKYVGDATELAGGSPRSSLEVQGGQKEAISLGSEVPLVKVHPQVLPVPAPLPQPLLSLATQQPAAAPMFTPRQVLSQSSMQPEPPSAFTAQAPLVPPTVQPELAKSVAFTFQSPPVWPPEPPKVSDFLFQPPPVRPPEPPKVSDFTFPQPLVRPMVQGESSSAFTVQPPLVQPAVTSETPKASEFTFQPPLVVPAVQPKASEFMFQAPLVRPEPSMAFSVQPPLVRPMGQPDQPDASPFTTPQSLVRPTVHSESQQPAPTAVALFSSNQPRSTVQPKSPPPQPQFTEQHISEVVEDLVDESVKEHCRVLSEAGATYASAALSVSSTEVKELLTTVTIELLSGLAMEEITAEKRRVLEEKHRLAEEKKRRAEEKKRREEEKRRAEEEKRRAEEEKRKAEEARLKQERRRLLDQLSLELCSELAEEVVKESSAQMSSSELKSAIEEDRLQRLARCSQKVSHHWTELFLEDEIFQTAKEALQELQCYCKYLQRWREVVVARKKLRRQMRAFPAAPCCVDRKDKLKALLPSAVSPPNRALFAKGILQLGHAGKLGVSYTRLQWLKQQTVHQMKVHYFHEQLICEAAWTPLDLPSLIAENLPTYKENVFWKMLLVLPDSDEFQDDGCSKLLAEWLKSKFMRVEDSPPPDDESKIQTLTAYKAVGLHGAGPVQVHVCVKVAFETLNNVELEEAETQKDLLGTNGVVLLLPAADSSQDLAEEDVYWLSALLKLKQLLQAKPFHPILPLVILVPGQDEPSVDREEEVEEGLMLQDLISAKLISEYIIVQIPESISDLQGSRQVSQAVKWLVSQTPSFSELCCQTLLQFIEDGVCRKFSVPFQNDRVARHRAGLPSQEPSAIVELYNSVLLFLAEVVSSEELSELSWPVPEFAEPGGNAMLPHLKWNTPEHLDWLKKVVHSFQIPHMDLPPIGAPWSPVCTMILQYVAQIPSSKMTQQILESHVNNLLYKTYARWKKQEFTYPEEDGPSVLEIPWGDLFMLCVDHKLWDWKPLRPPFVSEALTEDRHIEVYFFKEDLKKFVQPVSWEKARRRTLREIDDKGLESAVVNRSQVLASQRRNLSLSQTQDITLDTTPQTPVEVDITYVPSREELLPERLSMSLMVERDESQRFEDQLHRWLAEEPAGDLEAFLLPSYIPQTLISTPESIQPFRRPLSGSEGQAGSPVEDSAPLSEPLGSLSERLEQLRNLIHINREQDVACDLHLTTLLDVLDN